LFKSHSVPAGRLVLVGVFRNGNPVVQIDHKISGVNVKGKPRRVDIKVVQILMPQVVRITRRHGQVQIIDLRDRPVHLRVDVRAKDEIALGILLVTNVVVVIHSQSGRKLPRDRPPQQVVVANRTLRLLPRRRRQVACRRNPQRLLPADGFHGGKETRQRN
jgi:hypothetical protein